jgi:hypothetical protein
MNPDDKFCIDCKISITKSFFGYLEHHVDGVQRYEDGYRCNACHKRRNGKVQKK